MSFLQEIEFGSSESGKAAEKVLTFVLLSHHEREREFSQYMRAGTAAARYENNRSKLRTCLLYKQFLALIEPHALTQVLLNIENNVSF